MLYLTHTPRRRPFATKLGHGVYERDLWISETDEGADVDGATEKERVSELAGRGEGFLLVNESR
jgi:hypothetical protein